MTQAQLGLEAHSLSQLQAPPPTFSSQYQPAGQMPLPHALQVPSSQLGPRGTSELAAASSDSVGVLSGALSARSLAAVVVAALGSLAVTLGPPQPGRSESKARAKSRTRMVASVYVP